MWIRKLAELYGANINGLFYETMSFWIQKNNVTYVLNNYSVVSIKRTGSRNYFEVFYHPELFFHVLNEIFLPPWSFFHVLNEIFAPPCSLITSCSLIRYYRVGHVTNLIPCKDSRYLLLVVYVTKCMYDRPTLFILSIFSL